MSPNKTRRVVMAKAVAKRWLSAHVKPEYRLQVFYGAQDIHGLPGLLRYFRDGKTKIGSIQPIMDLGVLEEMDSFTIWSSDRVGMIALKDWFETKGLETSGVW